MLDKPKPFIRTALAKEMPKPPPRIKTPPIPVPRQVPPIIRAINKSEDCNNNTTRKIHSAPTSPSETQRRFQIGKSLNSVIEDVKERENKISDTNSISSYGSALESLENEMEFENMEIFNKNSEMKQVEKNRLCDDMGPLKRVDSVTSLRSMDTVPTFLGNGSIKKWNNYQNLDGISVDSSMFYNGASGQYNAGMF